VVRSRNHYYLGKKQFMCVVLSWTWLCQ